MSYLNFDRRLLSNLDESLQREYIRTNRMGAYCCSSIVGCNTRKYHGALVIPIPEISPNNHVLLSSLDLTIVQHEAPFNTAVHEYPEEVFSPKGHKYIRQYNVDVASQTTYRVGGVVLRKEYFLCHYEHRIIFKYTLLEANSKTTLRLSPLLAFRDVKMLTHRNDHINGTLSPIENGIGICLYEGYPTLHMQLSEGNKFVEKPHWNDQILYRKERERGYEHTEDLYVPGYFECDIALGQSIYFSAGIAPVECAEMGQLFEAELAVRIPREDFRSSLLNSAQQFYYRPNETDGYLLAGYPWFGVRARDLFVSLPGCSIYAGASERYDRVMSTVLPLLDDMMSQHHLESIITHMDDPDVGLWAIWAIQQYALKEGMQAAAERYTPFVSRMIHYYIDGGHPKVRLEHNALLYAESEAGEPISWMDAKVNGRAVIPRHGFLVELNALWYNALCFYREIKQGTTTIEISLLIEQIEQSFNATFVNQHGYLFDYVCYDAPQDWSVRPNMLLAVSLPYSTLSRGTMRSVMEYITRELRTPKGLRTLSPKSEGYRAKCSGSQLEREHAYYNGSVWAWLLGAYFDAYLKLYGKGALSYIDRTLVGMEQEVREHGIGTISELFDGNPPYRGRGAISLAMSVGEIIRSLYMLDKAKAEYYPKENGQ